MKTKRMMAYFQQVEDLKKRLVNFELKQIPREENGEAVKLARVASLVEYSEAGEVILLYAKSKTVSMEVSVVEDRPDWRIPIVHYLITDLVSDALRSLGKATPAQFYLQGDYLYKISFTHHYLRYLSKQEGEYILREIHQGAAGAHTGHKGLVRKVLRAG